MLESLIVLGQLSLGIIFGVSVVVVLSFTKNIFNQIIIPLIEPFIPHIKTVLDMLFSYLYDAVKVSEKVLKESLTYLKDKLIKTITKYKQISNTQVEMNQELYTRDSINNIKCMPVQTILNIAELPIEIKDNLDKTYYHDVELINDVMNKMVNHV